jgi:NAD(P)-dependent dehydrogenase (short-subunit alcohol dehydrogenase family)
MAKSDRPVALVTGASRGAGAGIARALGSYGMRVYVTGRAETVGEARGWDGAALPGTIHSTAAEVTAAGGEGIAVRCDHADDEHVQAVFAQIKAESGRLDLLVNNATMIHPELITPKPFWEKPLDAVGILDVGLRSAYVASWYAARIMVPQGSGLIAFGSSFGANCYMHGPGYGAQKAGIDKFAHDMQHDLSETGVNAVSIWMGPLRTERALMAAEVHPEQYEEIMKVAENPEYTGHLLHALTFGGAIERYAGKTVVGAELGVELGISDAGEYRPSHRDMLGGPPDRSSAVIY